MGYINPLLRLPAARGLMALGTSERAALSCVLLHLRAQANWEAETAWKRRKAPMACYWRAVSTYARHVAHALRAGQPAAALERVETSRGRAFSPCSGSGVMRAGDILALFEDPTLRGRSVPLDEALADFAAWLADRRAVLSGDACRQSAAADEAAKLHAVELKEQPATAAPLQRREAPVAFLRTGGRHAGIS